MKKKNLLLFAALALSASASAQEVVTVTSTDGKKEVDKGQITTFTFDGPLPIADGVCPREKTKGIPVLGMGMRDQPALVRTASAM